LPLWPDRKLNRKQKVLLLPLSFRGGQRWLRRHGGDWESPEHGRFVRALSGKYEPCWSRLIYRGGEFELQFTLKRTIQPIARPNLLGLHITQIQTGDAFSTCIFWALLRPGVSSAFDSGLVEVDNLSPGSKFPDREERRRLAYVAARRLIVLADLLDADLAVEEVKGVRKRGRGQGLRNRLGTSFNFSNLEQFIADKALDHPRPVVVWRVAGFKVLEQKKQNDSPERLASLVATQGWQIRERILSRR